MERWNDTALLANGEALCWIVSTRVFRYKVICGEVGGKKEGREEGREEVREGRRK